VRGYWGVTLDQVFAKVFARAEGLAKHVVLQYSGVRADGALELFLGFTDPLELGDPVIMERMLHQTVFQYEASVPAGNRQPLRVCRIVPCAGLAMQHFTAIMTLYRLVTIRSEEGFLLEGLSSPLMDKGGPSFFLLIYYLSLAASNVGR
jgi:hypothetical protein